jgi:predicted RNA-binding protein (virulence factor B family)
MTDYLSPGTIQELMVTSISEEGVFVGNDHEEIPLNKIDTKGVVLGQTLKIFSYFNDILNLFLRKTVLTRQCIFKNLNYFSIRGLRH